VVCRGVRYVLQEWGEDTVYDQGCNNTKALCLYLIGGVSVSVEYRNDRLCGSSGCGYFGRDNREAGPDARP
jgi:hypothetical protein